MPNENENFNSLNEETFIDELDALDEDARKDKILEIVRKHNEIGDKNRQIFERAKKAEGDLKELKAKDEETKAKPKKSDEELLNRLDTMARKIAGITADDEVELFNKWKTDTGREADDVIGNKIFQAELADLRTAKANAAATANVKGEDTASGTQGDPDYWIAKATKGSEGELMFPEDLPKDFKLRAAIVEKMGASAKASKEFYNQ